jgi:hypothetical protein
MKDFLPYKAYRLLDSAWIAGSSRATTRLRGPDDADYEVTIEVNQVGNPLRVFFSLREPTGEWTPAAISESAMLVPRKAEVEDHLVALERDLAKLKGTYADNNPQVVQKKAELEETRKKIEQLNLEMRVGPMKRSGAIINTTFNMDTGETVVVGTSRLKGDKALIALLTAVPRGRPKED